MNQKTLSSRLYCLGRAAAAAAALPVIFIYVMIAKPDYRIMNAAAHVVVPVATWVGDVVTWPVRAVGAMAGNIREMATLRSENEELRLRLDDALRHSAQCRVAIEENKKLARELDVRDSQPQRAVVADVWHDTSAFQHSTFLISKGADDGVEPDMAVTTFDGYLVGVVIDAGAHFARVRALTDADSNIAVRVVGSEVYGFLSGRGTARARMGFFSDPEFQPSAGITLVTSSISGKLPAGILVGDMTDDRDVAVRAPGALSRVMVLQFDSEAGYK